jgi:hypothetical protein
MFNNFLGGLSSGNGSGGGGDALPAAENRVTFDELEATADFENQLGPPPAGLITQTQGDAPTAGTHPHPQQAGMGGGSSPPGSRHTPASTPSSKIWEEKCTTRRPSRPSLPCN